MQKLYYIKAQAHCCVKLILHPDRIFGQKKIPTAAGISLTVCLHPPRPGTPPPAPGSGPRASCPPPGSPARS